MLQLYILINRNAPIEPPTREAVDVLYKRADADGNGYLDYEQFSGLRASPRPTRRAR